MSRIYEALQKAESERKSTQSNREGRRPEQPVDLGPRSQAAVAEYEDSAMQRAEMHHDLEPTVAPAEAFAYAPTAPSMDIDSVPKHVWTPSYSQLPSLLERGPGVEQFRSLRSRIQELRDIKPLKSILISSGLSQEGKSFVATNLAISLARHKNSKVLLIDGDMRRYTLHQLLGCQPYPGLADYLAGKAEMVEVMQRGEETPATDGVRPGAILPNLTFIAGGNGGDKAADLSGSPRFGELIRAASPHFDWIIVDSSPVLPVSDAVNLARSCDGVLLVARGGVTKFPEAQRAQTELRASNILGFVLNAVENQPEVGSYYGYDAEKE
jgi:protein-tyrosine kinase